MDTQALTFYIDLDENPEWVGDPVPRDPAERAAYHRRRLEAQAARVRYRRKTDDLRELRAISAARRKRQISAVALLQHESLGIAPPSPCRIVTVADADHEDTVEAVLRRWSRGAAMPRDSAAARATVSDLPCDDSAAPSAAGRKRPRPT